MLESSWARNVSCWSSSPLRLLQPGVLTLELLEPLGVVGIHPAVLRDPALPGRLSDLQMPTGLGELADDLVGRVPLVSPDGREAVPSGL